MRGIVVGKFLVDFQPGGQLPGGGALLVHRHWMAVRNRTISGRRDGVHVGYTGTDLGAAAFDLSHRSSRGAALGHAENRIRPPRSGVAGSDCGGGFFLLAGLSLAVQYEIYGLKYSLPSLLGGCSSAHPP